MNTKTIVTVLGVLVLATVAYLAFMKPAAVPSTRENQTPTTSDSGPNTKLNIDAICEGALAYMSFPSGAEAEAFVKDCKEGKHPEVIEQWKQDNGITDDRAI